MKIKDLYEKYEKSFEKDIQECWNLQEIQLYLVSLDKELHNLTIGSFIDLMRFIILKNLVNISREDIKQKYLKKIGKIEVEMNGE